MDTDKSVSNELTRRVIGCAFTVLNTLGPGFLEKVYENALAWELRDAGLGVEQQYGVTVTYKGQIVGEYWTDLLVEGRLLVEPKAASALGPAHHAQCVNYLKATGLQLCLLLNFGNPRLEINRIINTRVALP